MMDTSTRIDVAECVGVDALLGKRMGEAHFPLLLAAILRAGPDSVVYLDFGGISNITASYIATTIVRLLRMIASGTLDRHLVIAGVHQDYQDEISYVLEQEHTPVFLRSHTGELRLLGPLDNAYAVTLRAVIERGRVTARELQAAATSRIGQTGWVKRLTTLHDLGLVKRTKVGREHVYAPIITGAKSWVKNF